VPSHHTITPAVNSLRLSQHSLRGLTSTDTSLYPFADSIAAYLMPVIGKPTESDIPYQAYLANLKLGKAMVGKTVTVTNGDIRELFSKNLTGWAIIEGEKVKVKTYSRNFSIRGRKQYDFIKIITSVSISSEGKALRNKKYKHFILTGGEIIKLADFSNIPDYILDMCPSHLSPGQMFETHKDIVRVTINADFQVIMLQELGRYITVKTPLGQWQIGVKALTWSEVEQANNKGFPSQADLLNVMSLAGVNQRRELIEIEPDWNQASVLASLFNTTQLLDVLSAHKVPLNGNWIQNNSLVDSMHRLAFHWPQQEQMTIAHQIGDTYDEPWVDDQIYEESEKGNVAWADVNDAVADETGFFNSEVAEIYADIEEFPLEETLGEDMLMGNVLEGELWESLADLLAA